MLFAIVATVTILVTLSTFWPGEEPTPLPTGSDGHPVPRVEDEPAPAGKVLRAAKLFARGEYWDDRARYVFVEPEEVRVFDPVKLDVPVMGPPKIVMPLPDPGPLLRHSDALPRLDGSAPPGAAPAPAPAAEKAEKAGGAE